MSKELEKKQQLVEELEKAKVDLAQQPIEENGEDVIKVAKGEVTYKDYRRFYVTNEHFLPIYKITVEFIDTKTGRLLNKFEELYVTKESAFATFGERFVENHANHTYYDGHQEIFKKTYTVIDQNEETAVIRVSTLEQVKAYI